MKRLLTIAVGIWLGCYEFGDTLGQFLPSIGSMNSGYGVWQIVMLVLLATPIVVGAVVAGCDLLSWVFD